MILGYTYITFVFISCLMVVLTSYDSFGNLRRMTFDINVERLARPQLDLELELLLSD